jgi:two-component system response regulator GlrR
MPPRRLLVIGADANSSEVDVSALLAESEGFRIEQVSWDRVEFEWLRECRANAILAVVCRVCGKLREFLGCLSEHPLPMPTLVIFPPETEHELLRSAAEVVDDFVLAPVQPCEIECRLRRILGTHPTNTEAVQARLTAEFGLGLIATQNSSFQKIIETIPRIAGNNASVLITGETGVGKELCARAIHCLSPRASLPFIPMDCGALPENLMENEMYGHARGAYTGAHLEQKGLVALAENGTLFLDEVDSLSLQAQAKLLRLLQEHTYRPLGSEKFCQSGARVIAATNGNLDSLLRDGRFRRDLYYRLDILHLHIPPLRERKSDISLLAQRILDSVARETQTGRKHLSCVALRKLENHDWPGNVRELFNVVQRAAILSSAQEIHQQDLKLGPENDPAGGREEAETFRNARASAIEKFEKAYVTGLMEKHNGNITHAAREAGKDRRAFGRLVGKYQIQRQSAVRRGVSNPHPGQN